MHKKNSENLDSSDLLIKLKALMIWNLVTEDSDQVLILKSGGNSPVLASWEASNSKEAQSKLSRCHLISKSGQKSCSRKRWKCFTKETWMTRKELFTLTIWKLEVASSFGMWFQCWPRSSCLSGPNKWSLLSKSQSIAAIKPSPPPMDTKADFKICATGSSARKMKWLSMAAVKPRETVKHLINSILSTHLRQLLSLI